MYFFSMNHRTFQSTLDEISIIATKDSEKNGPETTACTAMQQPQVYRYHEFGIFTWSSAYYVDRAVYHSVTILKCTPLYSVGYFCAIR